MPNPLSQFGLTDLELKAAAATHAVEVGALEELTHRIEESLKEKAPVFDEVRDRRKTPGIGDQAGDFRDSIHTELTRGKDGLPGARVGSNSPIAIWQEVGTRHFPEDAIFAKTAQEFGDTTGPIFSEGVQQAQGHLRRELEALAELHAAGAASDRIAAQRARVNAARQARSSAFKAARGRRGRRRRR